jgi:predicted nuclease of predicted toxin-antitoxin system
LNTSLRLLIDEAIEDDIADEIAAMQAFNTDYVRKIPHLKGKPDKDIMNYARDEDRIVITFDHDYNSSNFPICTHPGIIRISSHCKHHATVRDVMRKMGIFT